MAYIINPFTGDLVPSIADAVSAKTLILEKEASESISALKLVYLDSSLSCSLADSSISGKINSCGVSINAGILGDIIKILSFGIIEDASFLFGVNEPLYLGTNGEITNIPPTTGYLTKIGYGLGAGSIYIKIEKPITL